VSPSGPDSIWVVTVSGELLQISKQGEHRKANIESGAVSVVTFIDSVHGWVADRKSRVWSTSDEGNSWQLVSASPEKDKDFYLPQQLIFVDELHGWLVGISMVWRTADGGRTWQERFSVGSNSEERIGRLYRGAFVGPESGWLASSGGVVIQTNDGGTSWKTLTPVAERMDLHGVFFSDEKTGWLIGRPDGGIYSTKDSGKTWRGEFTAVEGTYLNSVHFVNRNEGCAVGLTVKNQDREGLVLHSLDGGDKWAQVSTNMKERFFDRVAFYDQHHGWLIARDDIYYTDDGGQTFRTVLKLPPVKNGSE